MKRVLSAFFLLCLVGDASADLPDTLARVKRSVVAVGTVALPAKNNPTLMASGFAVGDGRHVVTVLGPISTAGSGKGQVLGIFSPADGSQVQFREAGIVARDAEHDLCLLRFQGPALPTLRIGRGEDAREGSLQAFTGFPSSGTVGLHVVTHRATIAAITPNIMQVGPGAKLGPDVLKKLTRPYDVFQLDATTYPGDGGSPLYEPSSGRVIGVINRAFVRATKEMTSADPSGIGYAIPATHVRSLLGQAGIKY